MSDESLKEKYFRLEQSLGYEYKDLKYLRLALTHRSFGAEHNERLEFLGDSILGMFIADKLYVAYPKVDEGDLTRMRSTLVREQTLAEIAREHKLSDYMRMGPGEMKSGGFRRDSILADAVESILASIYLDSDRNFELVRTVLLGWYKDRLKNILEDCNQKDPKTKLQEYLQGHHSPLPTYSVVSVSGEDHNQNFIIRLDVDFSKEPFTGIGSTRRKAEQYAASKALEFVKSHSNKV